MPSPSECVLKETEEGGRHSWKNPTNWRKKKGGGKEKDWFVWNSMWKGWMAFHFPRVFWHIFFLFSLQIFYRYSLLYPLLSLPSLARYIIILLFLFVVFLLLSIFSSSVYIYVFLRRYTSSSLTSFFHTFLSFFFTLSSSSLFFVLFSDTRPSFPLSLLLVKRQPRPKLTDSLDK